MNVRLMSKITSRAWYSGSGLQVAPRREAELLRTCVRASSVGAFDEAEWPLGLKHFPDALEDKFGFVEHLCVGEAERSNTVSAKV